MRVSLSPDEFVDVLRMLDEKLDSRGYRGKVDIHAIGGFALSWHGIRESGTGDIDTVTASYPDDVVECIREVGREADISENWLNNDCVLTYDPDDIVGDEDVCFHDSALGASYGDSGVGFSHIDLKVADIDTLVRSKVEAVNLGFGSTRTSKDLVDLGKLFQSQGIGSLKQAVSRYPYLGGPEYSSCRKSISDNLAAFSKYAGPTPASRAAGAKKLSACADIRPAEKGKRHAKL